MARRQTRPEEQPPDSEWLPDDSPVRPSVPDFDSSESSDTSSWLVEELSAATHEAPEAESDAPEDWDVPGLPPQEEMDEAAPDATEDQRSEGAGVRATKASEDAPPIVATADDGVRSDVDVLQTEVGDIRARLSAAAKRTAERRQRSAQEIEKLAMDLREEMAEARDRFEALMAGREELRRAQETFDRRQRKVLGAFARRLKRVEAGISGLTAQAESTQALLSVLSQRAAATEPEVSSEQLNLNGATFEDLRELGLSATQATRVLTYRDAHGFDTVERITELPGMPDQLLQSLKARLRV